MTTKQQRAIVIRAKVKLAGNPYRCDPGCKGWAVFLASDGFEVQACDDCWHAFKGNAPMRLRDDEAAFLPEAIDAVKRACTDHVKQYDKEYGRPIGSPKDYLTTELSRWQRSLGIPGLPGLSKDEGAELEEELQTARESMGVH